VTTSRSGHDPRIKDVGEISTELLFDLVVDLAPQLDIGAGPFGRRTLFGATGGSFRGPRLRGEVLAGGGDWALFRPDGVMALDVRLTLRTDDGALVQMTYGGRWVPDRDYFRTTPLFETGAERYSWLNDVVCVGSGYVVGDGVAYRVAQVV
jgi:hypothetical protein